MDNVLEHALAILNGNTTEGVTPGSQELCYA